MPRRGLFIIAATALAVSGGLLYVVLQTESGGMYFVVDVVDEKFTVFVLNPETIRLAKDNLQGLNGMHPSGELARGDGGFNKPWSWHLKPETVRMVEISTEVCDATPSMVEADLDYWVATVKYFCPLGAKIVAASPTIPPLVMSMSPVLGFPFPKLSSVSDTLTQLYHINSNGKIRDATKLFGAGNGSRDTKPKPRL